MQHRHVKHLAGLAGIAVLALAGTAAAAVGRSSTAGPGAEIAFVSERHGNPEIYAIRADGTGLRRLTNNRAGDYRPAWSPDGSRIAFTSNRHGNEELYVMDAEGRNVKRLTRHPGSDLAATWSPDGRRIAFTRVARNGAAEVLVMNTDGTGTRRISPRPVRGYGSYTPSWGVTGLIAFSGSFATPENPEIYVVRPNGTGLKRLTRTRGDAETLGDDGFPAWSPDGRRIAFSSNRTGEGELWMMNADGRGQRRFAGIKGRDDWAPTWSGDGTQLAFAAVDARGRGVIHVVGADGRGLRRLTPGDDPSWRPAAR